MNVRPLNPGLIVEAVADYFYLTPEDLRGYSCSKNVVRARQIAASLMYDETDLSLVQVGQELDRDHSTVIFARRRVEKHSAADPRFRAQVQELRGLIKARHEEGAS